MRHLYFLAGCIIALMGAYYVLGTYTPLGDWVDDTGAIVGLVLLFLGLLNLLNYFYGATARRRPLGRDPGQPVDADRHVAHRPGALAHRVAADRDPDLCHGAVAELPARRARRVAPAPPPDADRSTRHHGRRPRPRPRDQRRLHRRGVLPRRQAHQRARAPGQAR